MPDADEAVAEGLKCLVVGVAGGAVLVIEGAGAEAGGRGAPGWLKPSQQRSGQALVAQPKTSAAAKLSRPLSD